MNDGGLPPRADEKALVSAASSYSFYQFELNQETKITEEFKQILI